METHLRLHYAPDNASLIIRLAMEEMGVPYETVLVDRSADAQRSPAYLALNPNGLIPVLETEHGPVFETGAILMWLAEKQAKLAPLPGDPDRGSFLKWLFFVSNTLHSGLRMLFYPEKYVGHDDEACGKLRMSMGPVLAGHYTKLDKLAGEMPNWFAAQAPTVLDFYVACCLRWSALYPIGGTDWFTLDASPHLREFAKRLEQRPCVHRLIRAEGLGVTPFSCPQYANPPEGSAT